MSERAGMPASYDADITREPETCRLFDPVADYLLIDPDCRDGKHTSCVGGICECTCHITDEATS